MGPYKETHTMYHTVVVDVDGLHNFVSINRVLMTRTANEDELQCRVAEDVIADDN